MFFSLFKCTNLLAKQTLGICIPVSIKCLNQPAEAMQQATRRLFAAFRMYVSVMLYTFPSFKEVVC